MSIFKTVYVVLVWAICALVLFQTFGNYLTLTARSGSTTARGAG